MKIQLTPTSEGTRASVRVEGRGEIAWAGEGRFFDMTGANRYPVIVEENWNYRRTVRWKAKAGQWSAGKKRYYSPTCDRPRFVFGAHRVAPHDPHSVVAYRVAEKTPREPEKLLIHLHGGPESLEFGEQRFEGVFAQLALDGFQYLGWNYPGSAGLGQNWMRRPRKNWEHEILREWRKLKGWIRRRHPVIPIQNWVLVGASFGAMVALLIARKESALGRAILISPLLSLSSQMDRVRKIDPTQLEWFRSRFGKKDLRRLEFKNALAEIRCPLSIAFSGQDEVLGAECVRAAILVAERGGKTIDLFEQKRSFHVPRTVRARNARAAFILRQAVRS